MVTSEGGEDEVGTVLVHIKEIQDFEMNIKDGRIKFEGNFVGGTKL